MSAAGQLFTDHTDDDSTWVLSASFIDGNFFVIGAIERAQDFQLLKVGGSLAVHNRPKRFENALRPNTFSDLESIQISSIDGIIHEVHYQSFPMEPDALDDWDVGTGFPDNNCPGYVNTDCGNDVIDAGEECDDINGLSTDGCDTDCTIKQGGVCDAAKTSCALSCGENGDSVVSDNEECDDGNDENGDGCDEFCQLESSCGDGIITSPEECEDGNDDPGDGCFECLAEDGWECDSNGCNPICGDAMLVGKETCDPGERRDCTTDCISVKSGYTCPDKTDEEGQECQTVVSVTALRLVLAATILLVAAMALISAVSAIPGLNLLMLVALLQVMRLISLLANVDDGQKTVTTSDTTIFSGTFLFVQFATDFLFEDTGF